MNSLSLNDLYVLLHLDRHNDEPPETLPEDTLQAALATLETLDLIEPDGYDESPKVTSRGTAHLQQFVRVPLPHRVWADFEGRQIDMRGDLCDRRVQRITTVPAPSPEPEAPSPEHEELTPYQKRGWKPGDQFVVLDDRDSPFTAGSVVELYKDDETEVPLFKLITGDCKYNHADGSPGAYEVLDNLAPCPLPTPALTPCQRRGYKVGDQFRVLKETATFSAGAIVELYYDDETPVPLFKLIEGRCPFYAAGGARGAYMPIRNIAPYTEGAAA